MGIELPSQKEIADVVATFPKPKVTLGEGERVFEVLRREIRTAHPKDGIAVIDTKTKDWTYISCFAEADQAAAGMKNPSYVYFRACYNFPQ